ncbi:MAG: translation elongation factor Ts [Bdellovibrionaceae bacterium]|nr:translation elongation factor Ts [Pseudobdellovibrionaceae bacterium]
MTITANLVKELREKSGAGMMDCKKALAETNGNFEKAVDWLRQKGLASAGKKAGRIATEGVVEAYIHGEGRIGVLLEVNSETDFVARNQQFREFVRNIAMHVAATNPVSVSVEDVPKELVDREREVLLAKGREEGKKEEMLPKIVDGQIKKWLSQNVLLEQAYVKNPDVTIGSYLKETIATIGENLIIRRFVRFELGEGLQKKVDDFAAEVAAQAKA